MSRVARQGSRVKTCNHLCLPRASASLREIAFPTLDCFFHRHPQWPFFTPSFLRFVSC